MVISQTERQRLSEILRALEHAKLDIEAATLRALLASAPTTRDGRADGAPC